MKIAINENRRLMAAQSGGSAVAEAEARGNKSV